MTTTSCSKENEMKKQTYFQDNIDASVEFKLFNSEGNNLLSNSTTHHLTDSDIDWVYFEKGKEKVYYNPLMASSKNYSIKNTGIESYISLGLINQDSIFETFEINTSNFETTTYLRIGKNNPLDTIKATYKAIKNTNDGSFGGGGTYVTKQKVWFNKTLIYDKEAELDALPIIIK